MKIIISDNNCDIIVKSLDSAVCTIDSWYDSDGFGEPIREAAVKAAYDLKQPTLEGLQVYADNLCQKIAEELGNKDFYGHGNYHVSAAASGGFDLKIEIIYDLKHPITGIIRSRNVWEQLYWNSTPEEWGGANFEDINFEEVR